MFHGQIQKDYKMNISLNYYDLVQIKSGLALYKKDCSRWIGENDRSISEIEETEKIINRAIIEWEGMAGAMDLILGIKTAG